MQEKSPYESLQTDEYNHIFYSFCTYVSLCYDKKMNFATVFLKLLENKGLRDVFISLIDEDNEFNAIKKFIQTEPSISKSKYVTKFLNKFSGLE